MDSRGDGDSVERRPDQLKIGYLVPEFPGQTHGFFWREIVALEALGAHVTVFSTRRPKRSVRHSFSEEAEARTTYISDIKMLDLARWASGLVQSLRLMIRANIRKIARENGEQLLRLMILAVLACKLARDLERLSVSHIHGHSCADVGYLLAFCRLAGGPSYSLSLHGDLPVYGRGHEFKFEHAKFIACVTQALHRQVAENIPAASAKLEMIRMGIDFDPKNAKTDWGTGRDLKLITVSRLNAMKGHKHAIRAAKNLVDRGYRVTYDIVGEGEYRLEIEHIIDTMELSGQVRLIGAVPNDQITQLLPLYDVFVLPSVGLGEAAPVAVMEAMSASLVVVSSIIGGTAEMIDDGRNGFLFKQGDEAALSNILIKLADSALLRKQVGRAARDHAIKNFMTSRSAAQLIVAISNEVQADA